VRERVRRKGCVKRGIGRTEKVSVFLQKKEFVGEGAFLMDHLHKQNLA
jgi:hypothetical protein